MNCSVYAPLHLLPYRHHHHHPHQLSSFRIDDILKSPASSPSVTIDPASLWSSFAAQLLAYSPELLSIATTTTIPADVSPPIANIVSPPKHHHHHQRHHYHPYMASQRHSPGGSIKHKLSEGSTSISHHYQQQQQHSLSSSSLLKERVQQQQHVDRKDCLPVTPQPPPTAPTAFWPYLYTRCNPATSGSRRKGGQIRFSAEQSLQLEKKFETSQYLSPVERKQIAKSLQLSERQIKTWFQNRRAKHRRSAATVPKKDMDKSCSSRHQSDDEEDDIDIDDNVDEEHATSSNSN